MARATLDGELVDVHPLELQPGNAWHLTRPIPSSGLLVGIACDGDVIVSEVAIGDRPVAIAKREGEPPTAQAMTIEPLPVAEGEQLKYTLIPQTVSGPSKGWVAMVLRAADATAPRPNDAPKADIAPSSAAAAPAPTGALEPVRAPAPAPTPATPPTAPAGAERAQAAPARRFPLQGGLTISWTAAERAFEYYVRLFGTSQSLERLAERGGFSLLEFAALYTRQPARQVMALHELSLPDREIAHVLAEAEVRPA